MTFRPDWSNLADLHRNAVGVGVESQVQKSDPRGGQGREPPKCFGRLAMVQLDRAGNELTNRALDLPETDRARCPGCAPQSSLRDMIAT
jgi:hypothetical protein